MSGLSSDIRAHTGLRGIAALLIVALHYGHALKPAVDLHTLTGLIGQAGVFVDLFFMLSGFIMMACYGDQFAARVTGGAVRDYWVKRFARIYPLHLLTVLCMAVFAYKAGSLATDDLIENLLLVQAWGMNDHGTLNVVSWSISAEAFLYLVCPLLIVMLSRRGGWVALGVLALGCYGWLFLRGAGLGFDARLSLLRAVPSFVIGLMLAARRDRVGHWPPGLVRALQIGALAALGVLMHLRLWQPMLIACFAALILSTADDRGPVARALAHPAVQWLGVMSYALYMLHMPVRQVAYALAVRVMSGAGPASFAMGLVAMSLLGTLIAAPLIYRRLEMPARRWIVAHGRRAPGNGWLHPA